MPYLALLPVRKHGSEERTSRTVCFRSAELRGQRTVHQGEAWIKGYSKEGKKGGKEMNMCTGKASRTQMKD
jgi:hypothetical protein